MLEMWSNLEEIIEYSWSESLGSFRDYMNFSPIPKPKPISKLNLSIDCATDVQLFRESRRVFVEETRAFLKCDHNDTQCKKYHSENRKAVDWTAKRKTINLLINLLNE